MKSLIDSFPSQRNKDKEPKSRQRKFLSSLEFSLGRSTRRGSDESSRRATPQSAGSFVEVEATEVQCPPPAMSGSAARNVIGAGLSDEMQILVRTVGGTTFTLDARPQETIGSVKKRIQENTGVPSHLQRLKTSATSHGLLEDERTLGYYSIQNNATIYLLMQSPRISLMLSNVPSLAPTRSDSNTWSTDHVVDDDDDEPFDSLTQVIADYLTITGETLEFDYDPRETSGTVLPNTFLRIPESQDDVSVLTFASDISKTISESSVSTPRASNRTSYQTSKRSWSIATSRGKTGEEGFGDDREERLTNVEESRRAILKEPVLIGKDSSGMVEPSVYDCQPVPIPIHVSIPIHRATFAEEGMYSVESWSQITASSDCCDVTSASAIHSTNDVELYARIYNHVQQDPPLASPPEVARDTDEDTMYTTVADRPVSADCGRTTVSALTSSERSQLIKQGRCPCGIQTHKSTGMFKGRRLRPLSNENVLSGRCLICNPTDVVTREAIDNPASISKDGTIDVSRDEHGKAGSASSENENVRVLDVKAKTKISEEARTKSSEGAHLIDYPCPPPFAPSLATSLVPEAEAEDDPSRTTFEKLRPSAPSLEMIHFGGGTEGEGSCGDSRREYFTKAQSRDEIEQWLLYRLPTLQKDDVDEYCEALAKDGFDSLATLDAVEDGDLGFMKKGHRRVMAKILQSAIDAESLLREQLVSRACDPSAKLE